MSNTYRWKPNVPSSLVKLDAQVVGEEIERLESASQHKLSPEEIVRAAKVPASPLHPAFEWDDAKAAARYRIDQARHLISLIDVVIIREDQTEGAIRAFVSVTSDEGRGYVSTVHALSDEDMRKQVLKRAWQELEAWRQRHAELVEFGRLFSAIDEARGAAE